MVDLVSIISNWKRYNTISVGSSGTLKERAANKVGEITRSRPSVPKNISSILKMINHYGDEVLKVYEVNQDADR